MSPREGNTTLPKTPFSLSRVLEGLFELTQIPLRALDSPLALLPKVQGYKDTLICAATSKEVPGQRQEQLIVGLSKTHFFCCPET